MKFLLDQHLPVALISLMERLGHEAVHVKPLGMGDAVDPDIWLAAVQRDAVVVSKDSDFLRLTASGGRLVHLRIGNCSNRVLLGSWNATGPLWSSNWRRANTWSN